MTDFLISTHQNHSGRDLLSILRNFLGSEGKFYEQKRFVAVVLYDHLAHKTNIREYSDKVFAWVGDLVWPYLDSEISDFVLNLEKLFEREDQSAITTICKLNGAFAAFLIKENVFFVLTDPLLYTDIFWAIDNETDSSQVVISTSSQVIYSLMKNPRDWDYLSIGEFLNSGTTIFPYTFHKQVNRLYPGTIYKFELEPRLEIKEIKYWKPPAEEKDINEPSLCQQLRAALKNSVEDRVRNSQKVGVALSGGMDSRLIMALVPPDKECIGLTLCDTLNREARIARKVAKAYKRQWLPIVRHKNYLTDCLLKVVDVIGCDYDWADAHFMASENTIREYGLDVMLNGMEFDVYFKGYSARDYIRQKRWGGLVKPRYVKDCVEVRNIIPAYISDNVTEEVINQIIRRRKAFLDEFFDPSRSSPYEWFKIYPFSQDESGSCWSAERRFFPEKFVAFDRRILECAFRCPLKLKFEKRFFLKTALPLYGPGKKIPLSDSGVKLGSNRIAYLFQRFKRKTFDLTRGKVYSFFGKPIPIEHSWHNYQDFWDHDLILRKLIEDNAEYLNILNGYVFKKAGADIIQSKLFWGFGFRLIQLALWLKKCYR